MRGTSRLSAATGFSGTAALDPAWCEAGGGETLDAAVSGVDTEGLGEPVQKILVEGPGARELLDASNGADMLVVGDLGHGGFAGLLLGSVSQQVARDARCPVVIVPADR